MVQGLARPLAVTGAGDGSGRLFIAEQAGLIHVWDGTRLLPTPFLDLTALTTCCGERGLLGLAFDPDYETNGFFYVGYTDLGFDTVIARYSVSPDPDVADPSSALTLLEQEQPNSNHNNGTLAFGPDGYLYVGLGDGGGGQADNAQDLTSLLGSILRIDPDGDDFPAEPSRNYAIPPENPFVGIPGRDEIWVYGLRNPWRFSFDRETGDLLIGDVGQQLYEEIDHQPAGSPGGENYGWPLMEAASCHDPPADCNDGSLSLPVIWYSQNPECAVTGGYRYRGPAEPRLSGVYLYGDFCTGTVWGTVPSCDPGSQWVTRPLLDSGLLISSFGEDDRGEIYVVHLDSSNGGIYRLRASDAGGPTITSSPPALDFGAVPPATLASLPFELSNTNTGPEAVIVERIEPGETVAFGLDLGAGGAPCGPPPICLSPGDSCTLEVDLGSLGGSFDSRLVVDGNFADIAVPLAAQVSCGGPDHLVVDQQSITATAELVGCSGVTLGPDLILESGANVAARAGGAVLLADGVTFEGGSRVRIQNDPSLLP